MTIKNKVRIRQIMDKDPTERNLQMKFNNKNIKNESRLKILEKRSEI